MHKNVSARPASGCSRAASVQIVPVTASVASGSTAATIPPPSNSPRGVLGKTARRRFSSAEMHRPIHTTGWGSHAGSPNTASSTKPPATATPVSM